MSVRQNGIAEGIGLLPRVSDQQINALLRRARSSKRRRAIFNFHRPNERLQRMLNAGMHDTYVAPHVHDHPRKLEIFVILKGSIAVVAFDDADNLADCVILSERGPIRATEIPAGTWHSFVVLTRSAVVYELVDGRYGPRTHKHFAPWAPSERDARSASAFLRKLRCQIGLAAKKQRGRKRFSDWGATMESCVTPSERSESRGLSGEIPRLGRRRPHSE